MFQWLHHIYLIIMELGRIFVRTNLAPKLTKEFAADANETTKRCPGGDLDGHFHC